MEICLAGKGKRWCPEETYFSHGDKIIVDINGACSIIDWETAGFYPSYEEYYFCDRYRDTWKELDI